MRVRALSGTLECSLKVFTLIIFGIFCCNCGKSRSCVCIRSSCQDPDNFLTEKTEEIFLAIFDDSPIGKVCVKDCIIVLINVIEADIALTNTIIANSSSGICGGINNWLSRLTLRVKDLNWAVALLDILSLNAITSLIPNALVTNSLIPYTSVLIDTKALLYLSSGAWTPLPAAWHLPN